MTHVSTMTDAVDGANQKLEDRFSPYVRDQAMRQIDMKGFCRMPALSMKTAT